MRFLSIATVFAALSGFLVIIIATKTLDAETAKSFQAYWGLFFACTGILDGIMQETTRTVSMQRETTQKVPAHPDHGGVDKQDKQKPTLAHWHFGLLVGLTVAALSLLTESWWMPRILTDYQMAGSGLLALGLCLYAFQAVLSGVLSGWEQWPQYAWLIALDSGIRFLLAALAFLFGWDLLPFLLLTVVGTLSWAIIVLSNRGAREHLRTPLPVSLRTFARRAGSAMLATGASAAIISGIAPLISATLEEPEARAGVALSGIMIAVSFTRAPILVPLQRFQSALIVYFVRHRERMRQAVLAPAAAVLGVGAFGAVLAWLIGPWLLRVGWDNDPAYAVPGPLLAALTFASACTGVLMITGAASIAAERHRLYVLGWVGASVTVGAILWWGTDPLTTVPAALIIGPLVGTVIHLSALRAPRGTEATQRAGQHRR
ncbi:hypothetical protein [Corynebacterium lowii]|uniref:Polysaccharide biosynthesis protein n=1 Tax=Corynebacterium lowii TaxID=1544413 RepID=A0A0Q0ZB93_9CORY|nr:hypothetical protein [Corynebacterium lowii]KQB87264.1 hypothetical protein Clow_00319 [Corynebacterium lowii]MDP9852149.1 hypothetical protein [Corynebacterium lowii]